MGFICRVTTVCTKCFSYDLISTVFFPSKHFQIKRCSLSMQLYAILPYRSRNTVKPWMWITSSTNVPQDEQTFLINFILIGERCLAIRVERDTKCHMVTTESMVVDICFDIQVLWITSMFPEQMTLTNQGFTGHSSSPQRKPSMCFQLFHLAPDPGFLEMSSLHLTGLESSLGIL